jgi:hypothetical protein
VFFAGDFEPGIPILAGLPFTGPTVITPSIPVCGSEALRQGGGSRIEWTSSGSSGSKHRKSEILKCEDGRDQQFRLQQPENDIA